MRYQALVLIALGCSWACKKDPPAPAPAAENPLARPAPVNEDATTAAVAPTASAPATTATALALVRIEPTALDAALTHEGKVVRAYEWSDANGKNAVVFSALDKEGYDEEMDQPGKSRYLFVTHQVEQNGGWRQLRLVRDKEEGCSFDLTADFDWAALSLTDLDADGLGELTFAYELTCRSDVSPSDLKLLLLESGDKYIIRGTTTFPEMGSEEGFGRRELDAATKKAAEAFRKHMLAAWELVVEDGFGD